MCLFLASIGAVCGVEMNGKSLSYLNSNSVDLQDLDSEHTLIDIDSVRNMWQQK